LLDGRFLIKDVAGRSMATTVYEARDVQTGHDVAVKVPHLRTESDPVAFGRFQREERIGLMLSDPFLLRFVPVGESRSRPYLVTEFIDGCNLAFVIHRTKPIPERDALRIASSLCAALGKMHERRIIHRDLKPDNIMVCRDGRICLVDFGMSAGLDEGRGLLASLAPLFGTPEFMAPEQVRNKRNDERTDIYSLGVILYQMLTGVLPYRNEDPWVAAHMRVNGDPPAPRSINPDLSPQAEEIVLCALRRKPEERYRTVAAFKAALDAPDRVHVTGLSQRLEAPKWRLSLHGTPILAGLLIGFCALAAMVGMFFVLFLLMRHR